MNYTDRNGKPLEPGQIVTIQYCTGKYGQTSQVTGELVSIDAWAGLRIRLCHEYTEYVKNCANQYQIGEEFYIASIFAAPVDGTMRGFSKFEDIEHGHERWCEIKTGIPAPGPAPVQPSLSHEEAMELCARLFRTYGLRWTAAVPRSAWVQLERCNKVLTVSDRRAAAGLPR